MILALDGRQIRLTSTIRVSPRKVACHATLRGGRLERSKATGFQSGPVRWNALSAKEKGRGAAAFL
jgi:hypothetical protein